jgi:hypothetical protein
MTSAGASEQAVARPPERARRGTKLLSAIGVIAAATLAVNANILAARWYARWDVTRERLYTLSPSTTELLGGLDETVTVLVFLSRSDPLLVSVRHMLTAYRAKSQRLTARFVDPDQNPTEFLALQRKYGILAGKAEDGRLITDAALVVTRGDRHWFVTAEELVRYDDSGNSRPRLEQALSEAIANVRGDEKAKICFSSGQRELSLDDGGPEGLGELRHQLEKNNYELETRDLSRPNSNLGGCRALVVAGPALPFSREAATRIADYVKAGGSALLFVGPRLDEHQNVQSSGLEPVAELARLSFGRDFVLESDEAMRLPRGAGEVFFARPKAHDITRGLIGPLEGSDTRVLVSEAQSLRPLEGAQPKPLIASGNQALSLDDLAAFVDPERQREALERARRGEYTLAFATELEKPAGSPHRYGPRLVIAGASNLLWGRNFRDPALYGNRLFVENAVSWAAARPAMISVPEKPAREIGLNLSEDSLGEVLRYVLIYMPGSAALLGVFVLIRRRATEKSSRRSPKGTES